MFIPSVLAFSFLCKLVSGETYDLSLREYLIEGQQLPSDLEIVRQVAISEADRIEELTSTVSNAVVFLPKDDAFEEHPWLADVLTNKNLKERDLLYDILLATSGDAADSSTEWEALVETADSNSGTMDTAYGTPFFLKKKDRRTGLVCSAEWDSDSNRHVEGECADVELPGTELLDATIYFVSRIILPAPLMEELAVAYENM